MCALHCAQLLNTIAQNRRVNFSLLPSRELTLKIWANFNFLLRRIQKRTRQQADFHSITFGPVTLFGPMIKGSCGPSQNCGSADWQRNNTSRLCTPPNGARVLSAYAPGPRAPDTTSNGAPPPLIFAATALRALSTKLLSSDWLWTMRVSRWLPDTSATTVRQFGFRGETSRSTLTTLGELFW